MTTFYNYIERIATVNKELRQKFFVTLLLFSVFTIYEYG